MKNPRFQRVPTTAWLFASGACLAAIVGGGVAHRLGIAALAHPDPAFAKSSSKVLSLPIPFVRYVADGWPVFIGILITLSLVCWLAMRASRLAADNGASSRTVLIFQAAVYLALTTCAITISGDAYLFVLWGRLYGVLGANPYDAAASVSVSDPIVLRLLAGYPYPPAPADYGPLWTLIMGALARAESAVPLGAQVWSLRLLTVGSAILATAGLARLIRNIAPGERLRRLAFFAFNPLMMYECAVEAHADMLVVAAAVWAFALAESAPLIAGLVMGGAIALKFVPLLLLPFLALYIARRHGGAVATGSAATALVAFIIFWAPFWSSLRVAQPLHVRATTLSLSLSWTVVESWRLLTTHDISGPVIGIAVAVLFLIVLLSLFRFWRRERARELWRTIATVIFAAPGLNPEIVLWLSPAMISCSQWSPYSWALATSGMSFYALFMVPVQPNLITFEERLTVIAIVVIVPLLCSRFWRQKSLS